LHRVHVDGRAVARAAGEGTRRGRLSAFAVRIGNEDRGFDADRLAVRMGIEDPHVRRTGAGRLGRLEATLFLQNLQVLGEQRRADFVDVAEAHLVVLVHGVDTAPTDVVVGVVLEERGPGLAEEGACIVAPVFGVEPGAHRLGHPREQRLRAVVPALQVEARGVDVLEDRVVGVAEEVALVGTEGLAVGLRVHRLDERGKRAVL
jgi:hypothetical protein